MFKNPDIFAEYEKAVIREWLSMRCRICGVTREKHNITCGKFPHAFEDSEDEWLLFEQRKKRLIEYFKAKERLMEV